MNLKKQQIMVLSLIFIVSIINSSCIINPDKTSSIDENHNTMTKKSNISSNDIKNIEDTENSNHNSTLSKIAPQNSNYIIKLIPPKNDQIYFGAFPDFGGPEDNVSVERIKRFETLAQKNIAWAYFSQNWFNGITYPKKAIHDITKAGTIPFVRLMPRSDEKQFHPEPLFSMQHIIDGQFDSELRQWAKNAKIDFEQTHVPLLIDFAVEMNGDWFPWSGIQLGGKTTTKYGDPTYPDGPEQFRDAYRHIIDIFRDENVTHITWFFHVDIYSEPPEEWNQPKYYYPGDDYIDWIGISCYGPQNPNEGYWDTFSEILNERSSSIKEISISKPLALLEFGVTDNSPLGKKNEWLKDAFSTIKSKQYLNFSAISYWNELWEEEDDLWATLEIDSSKESLETFQKECNDDIFISSLRFEEISEQETNEKTKTEKNTSVLESKEPTSTNAKLLFKSGFEGDVYIDEELVEDAEEYRIIRGSDYQGFSWPITILGATDESGLHYIGDDNQKAIFSRIETTIGHDGTQTRALYQQENYKTEDCTQCPYEILDITNGTQDLYIRHWIKIDSESVTKQNDNLWRTFFEFKTKDYAKGTGFRLITFIYTEEDGIPYWSFQGDKDPEHPLWEIDNKEIPVPLDEWFLTEFYWHWSENDDGRALWKINGQVIGDHKGPTTRNGKPIDFIMLFQLYGNGNPKHQWIDDIEIWNAIPDTYKTSSRIDSRNIDDTTNNKDTDKPAWFIPRPKTTWQWQLTGTINTSYNAQLYDIDLFETPQATIDELHAQNKKVICYISAGSVEDWRPDAKMFPTSIIGKAYKGWEGENWLDISNYEQFADIMTKRLDLAVSKGCDGIEPDNIHGYQENTGFDLTYDDQLRYNHWLADEAHKRNLSIALKNDGEQASDLVTDYDFAIVEECFEFDECNPYSVFIEHNKAVLGVEYNLKPEQFCDKANELQFSWLKMDYDLDGGRISCN